MTLSRESSLADILEGIPPTFTVRPQTKIVTEDEDVELEFRLFGVPEPEIEVFFNNTKIKETSRTTVNVISDVHMYSCIIRIKKIQISEQGSYQITAKNSEGRATNSIELQVMPKEEHAPIIIEPLVPQSARTETPVTFTAKIIGKPIPKVTWYHNSIEITKTEEITIEKTDESTFTLIIRKTKPESDGDYLLSAENKHGSVSTSATLTITEQPPKFIQTFPPQSLTDEPLTLKVKYIGNPTTVKWFKDNTEIPSTNYVDKTNETCSLVIAEPGTYSVLLKNKYGQVKHTANVIKEESFIKKLTDLEKAEHEEAEFHVQVTGGNVTWHKDGEQLVENDRIQFVVDGQNRKLIIRELSVHDEGEYTCVLGDNECTAELAVIGKY